MIQIIVQIISCLRIKNTEIGTYLYVNISVELHEQIHHIRSTMFDYMMYGCPTGTVITIQIKFWVLIFKERSNRI